MEHETSVLAGRLWVAALDEYLGSRSPKFSTFEPEQLARLREALSTLVQPIPGMGVFIATRMRAAVQSAAHQLVKKNAAMNEWLEEAERHHVHEVVRIRDRMYRQLPKSATIERRAGAPVPMPRHLEDTLQEIQPSAKDPKPPPPPREITESMEDAADAFEAGIDDIFDDENEVTPTNVVIDVDEG